MSLSIDKIQNTESVAFMLLLQNYHRDCYIITYPLRWKMTPLQWKMTLPMENDFLTPPMENDRVIRIDPLSGNKE